MKFYKIHKNKLYFYDKSCRITLTIDLITSTIHDIYVTDHKLFTGKCFPFAKVSQRNVDNDANLHQVIDETSTVREEFATSSENKCLFAIMYADDSFCERILDKMNTKNTACFMSLSNLSDPDTLIEFPLSIRENDRRIIVLWGKLRNIYLRIVHMEISQ
jgi:hypothetical protein